MKCVPDTLKINKNDCLYFSDSTIILSWLKLSAERLKTYVANRDSYENSKISQWFHAVTNENLADLATRGSHVPNFIENSLWKCGQKWLLNDVDFKLEHVNAFENILEVRVKRNPKLNIVLREDIFLRYASCMKLLRVGGFTNMFKLINILRHVDSPMNKLSAQN